jgi:hypothetical protein
MSNIRNFKSEKQKLLVIRIFYAYWCECRSKWLRVLRRGSTAARLLGLWVRIPPGHGCLSVLSVVR